MFLNSPQARSYAEGLARRLDGLQGRSAVQQAYRIAYGRTADADELAAAEEFLDRQRRSYANEGQWMHRPWPSRITVRRCWV